MANDQRGYGLKGAWLKLWRRIKYNWNNPFQWRLLHGIKDMWVEWRRQH